MQNLQVLSNKYIRKTKDNKVYDYDKIVILQDENTASASEIMISCLSYHLKDKVTLVGTKSYGKGKVQTTGELEDGTMIKYTSALWYTPNGDTIDEIGLVPDIEVKLDEKYMDNPIDKNDNQLNEAIKILTKQ